MKMYTRYIKESQIDDFENDFLKITHMNDLEISFDFIDEPSEPGGTHGGYELRYRHNNETIFIINKHTDIAWIDENVFYILNRIKNIYPRHAKIITQLLEKYLNLQFTLSECIEIY